jgi:hypothetical protein
MLLMSTPQDLTPLFNSIPIRDKIYPLNMEKFIIDLDGTNPTAITLPIDVNSVKIVNSSTHTAFFNVSYTDGTNESPGNLTGTTTNRRVHEVPAGGSFDLIQEQKFNRIHAAAANNIDLIAYPGKGYTNGLPS